MTAQQTKAAKTKDIQTKTTINIGQCPLIILTPLMCGTYVDKGMSTKDIVHTDDFSSFAPLSFRSVPVTMVLLF